ncbi:Fe-S cluster assembly ATPase SufC [Candidatus Woesearchaeota archaeon CG10_big_fil_rev_8_21_14_0_10_37_12]|nr:MAG: Fe-S cluster assembly ATPase SufC [Candidatus Woesearchaeota archaeon CG10_big_fil_rev_8_21_14_0_10_37_12]
MKLEIKDLHVFAEGKKILNGISLVINPGEIHVIMGPNGSGKSTLSYVLAGHPSYKVEKGDMLIDGQSILDLSPDERSKKGLFLLFQNPVELEGINLSKFLFTLAKQKNKTVSFTDFKKQLDINLKLLEVDESFVDRDVHVGLSGGEKKRAEVLQLLTLQPSFAILDELDSGLDVDSLQLLAKTVNKLRTPDFSALIITHYQRLLNCLQPDVVHVMIDGKIVKSGNADLAKEVEEEGYQSAK